MGVPTHSPLHNRNTMADGAPTQQPDDEVLVQETLDGKTQAFDELVRRHSRKLHAMLLQMVGSEADAYDIAQESFLKAFHSLRYFNGRSAFYTWLYSIAANQARNFIRKRKRENTSSIDNDENGDRLEKDNDLADPALTADPARRAHLTDLRRKLIAALDKLSPAHREVVTMCDIHGLSYPEISRILNISEGTLRSRLHYAHRLLQGLLADER